MYIYILPVKQCFKPQFAPVVKTTLAPINRQFLFDAVVLAQHGGVRYDNTSYTAYLIRAEYCHVAVLYTADNYSRHFLRSFPSNNMFAVSRCVVTLQFRLVPKVMVNVRVRERTSERQWVFATGRERLRIADSRTLLQTSHELLLACTAAVYY